MTEHVPVRKRGRKPLLTEADVAEIKEMYASKTDPIGWTVAAIARVMNISAGLVNKALAGTAVTRDGDGKTD